MRCEQRENVEDALTPIVVGRHGDQLVVHIIYIFQGYASPSLVVCIEMGEFHTENSRLDLIETRISAAMVEDIFARRTIVGKCAEECGKLFIVSRYCSAIAQCTKIFSRIETVAYDTCRSARHSDSMPLCIVNNKEKVVSGAYIAYNLRIGIAPLEVDEKDCLGA